MTDKLCAGVTKRCIEVLNCLHARPHSHFRGDSRHEGCGYSKKCVPNAKNIGCKQFDYSKPPLSFSIYNEWFNETSKKVFAKKYTSELEFAGALLFLLR